MDFLLSRKNIHRFFDKPKTLHSSCKYPTPQEHLPSNLRHPLLTQFFQLFHKELLLSLHLLSLHQAFPKLPALPDSLSISSHFLDDLSASIHLWKVMSIYSGFLLLLFPAPAHTMHMPTLLRFFVSAVSSALSPDILHPSSHTNRLVFQLFLQKHEACLYQTHMYKFPSRYHPHLTD